jgi:site-specific recombinase XerD
MAVRPWKNKQGEIVPGSWEIDYFPMGKKGGRSRHKFEGKEEDAIVYEMELRRLSKRAPMSPTPKVSAVLPTWQHEYQNNHLPQTNRDMRVVLKHLVKYFSGLYLEEITPAIIEQYKAARRESGLSMRTINKELSYLSNFLKWCFERDHMSREIKPKRYPAKYTTSAKPRIPTIDEINAMIAAIEPRYLPIFLLIFDAGLRISEAVNLKSADVDLKACELWIRGKGNKERILPIATPRLLKALTKATKERTQTEEGWLFVNPKTKKPWYSIRKAIIRAGQKAGISQRVYHHLMRHSFFTHALAAGVDIRTLQIFGGHSTVKTTEGYTQLVGDLRRRESANPMGSGLQDGKLVLSSFHAP